MKPPSIRPMTDRQLNVIREQKLRLVRTLMDGSLVVYDQVGDLHELSADGTLLPCVPIDRGVRVRLDELPEETP